LKKVISILLSFLIFLSTSGYVLIYVERLANNKIEMRAILTSKQNSSLLLKLKFAKNEFFRDLNWKDEYEFEFNGEMYDVAKIERSGDTVFIYCIRDKNEELLISNYEKVSMTNSEKDKIASSPQTSLIHLQLIAIQNELFSYKRITNLVHFSESYINNYRSIYQQSPTPPPKTS
jgi:hypothetical protein